MAISENSKKIFSYVKANEGKNFTAADIAVSLDLDPKAVNGAVTAFQRKGLMARIPAEIELSDGTHKAVKLVAITDAGKEFEVEE